MRMSRSYTAITCLLAMIAFSTVLWRGNDGKGPNPQFLQTAPAWVRQQQAAEMRKGFIDKLERTEENDHSIIDAMQQVTSSSFFHVFYCVHFLLLRLLPCSHSLTTLRNKDLKSSTLGRTDVHAPVLTWRGNVYVACISVYE